MYNTRDYDVSKPMSRAIWATANGDMNRMKNVIFQKTEHAVEMLEGHPLPPDVAIEFFKSKALGMFRYSAPFVPWTEKELEQLQTCGAMDTKEVGKSRMTQLRRLSRCHRG
jgi:hypothetical protein